mmetsp:Transcript_27329/g.76308  ORF Transcript_27329/g.76308 Transcript_27329/m.76308 type:complete len:126 (+) Transcript_27329:63-440(+)
MEGRRSRNVVPWKVTYHDGSSNGYVFSRSSSNGPIHFEYIPVTLERSSSGTYSGGEPVKASIHVEEEAGLWRWVDRLDAELDLHTDARMMGTGAFCIQTPLYERKFVMKRTSLLGDFHAYVQKFR